MRASAQPGRSQSARLPGLGHFKLTERVDRCRDNASLLRQTGHSAVLNGLAGFNRSLDQPETRARMRNARIRAPAPCGERPQEKRLRTGRAYRGGEIGKPVQDGSEFRREEKLWYSWVGTA